MRRLIKSMTKTKTSLTKFNIYELDEGSLYKYEINILSLDGDSEPTDNFEWVGTEYTDDLKEFFKEYGYEE